MRTTPRRSELSATTLARSISRARKCATRGKSTALELARALRRLASFSITVMGGNTMSGLPLRLVMLIAFSFLSGCWSGIIVIRAPFSLEHRIAEQHSDDVVRIAATDAFDPDDIGASGDEEGDFASDLQPHQRCAQR